MNQEEGFYSWWWKKVGSCNLHAWIGESDDVPGVLETLLVPYTTTTPTTPPPEKRKKKPQPDAYSPIVSPVSLQIRKYFLSYRMLQEKGDPLPAHPAMSA